MMLYKLNIKSKEFKVAVADTDSSRKKGLSGVKRLGNNKGMLFIFPTPQRVNMVMKSMNFDLDFLFLDKDFEIIQTGSMTKDDTKGLASTSPVAMVLEVPFGTIDKLGLSTDMRLVPSEELDTHSKGVAKFKKGGRFEMVGDKIYRIKVDDVKAEEGRLQILNENGEVVANIDSGARIFSREHTKSLVEEYKKGNKSGMADLLLEVLDIQDNQKQEYVTNE